jgi:hypothetical protein
MKTIIIGYTSNEVVDMKTDTISEITEKINLMELILSNKVHTKKIIEFYTKSIVSLKYEIDVIKCK